MNFRASLCTYDQGHETMERAMVRTGANGGSSERGYRKRGEIPEA
jgi:hypothetical protein